MKKLSYILFLLFAVSCGSSNEETCQDNVDVSKIPLKVSFIRLEDELFACKSKADIQKFVSKYDTLFKRYDRYIPKSKEDTLSLENRLWKMVQNKYMDTLYRDVKKRFDDPKDGKWKQVEKDFENAFKHIKHYYPTFQPPKIYTTITGLGSFWGGKHDIEIDRNSIIISLDIYYGEGRRIGYRPNPKQYPEYILRRLSPEYIAPSCILVMSDLYNKVDMKDQTLIAHMIGAGKSLAFVREMMPCLPDTLLMGYTKKDVANLNDKENREYIWNYLVEKKYIFSNSKEIARRFLDEAPYVVEINDRCPGRVGWWIGARIIRKYRQKFPNITFQELMNKSSAKEVFEASGYNGQ